MAGDPDGVVVVDVVLAVSRPAAVVVVVVVDAPGWEVVVVDVDSPAPPDPPELPEPERCGDGRLGGLGATGGATNPGAGSTATAATAVSSCASLSVASDDALARTTIVPAANGRAVTATTADPWTARSGTEHRAVSPLRWHEPPAAVAVSAVAPPMSTTTSVPVAAPGPAFETVANALTVPPAYDGVGPAATFVARSAAGRTRTRTVARSSSPPAATV